MDVAQHIVLVKMLVTPDKGCLCSSIRGSVSRCEEDNVSSGWNYSDQTVPRRKVNRIKMVTAIILHVTCVTCISVVRSFSSRELLLGTISLTFDGLSFHSNLKDGSSQMGVIE